MKCEQVRKRLPLAVGKDLDARAQAAFDEHVAGCLTCFREVAAYRRSRAALKSARPAHDRDELDAMTTSIMARVHAGEAGPVAPVPHSWFERVRFALPLAALFIGCAWAGVLIFASGGGSGVGTDGGSAAGIGSAANARLHNSGSEALNVTTVASDELGAARMIVIPPAPLDRVAAGPKVGDPKVVKVAPIEPWKIVRRADDF